MQQEKNVKDLISEAAAVKGDGDFFLPLCDYSHDYDGAVYEEDVCSCGICRKDGSYCLRQDYKVKWDRKVTSDDTAYFPIADEEMKLSKAEFCKRHCKNEWAFTYNIFERLK